MEVAAPRVLRGGYAPKVNESARQELRALVRRDGEEALGLVLRLVAHEMRNCMNPLSMQLAILRRQARAHDRDLQDVIEGMHEAIARSNRVLDGVARIGQEIAPGEGDDAELRELWDQLRAEL